MLMALSVDERKFLRAAGLRVRRAREANSLTLHEFSILSEMHATYCGGFERGERNIGIVNLRRIAKALGVDPSSLLPPLLIVLFLAGLTFSLSSLPKNSASTITGSLGPAQRTKCERTTHSACLLGS